jgi:hypothetical protein
MMMMMMMMMMIEVEMLGVMTPCSFAVGSSLWWRQQGPTATLHGVISPESLGLNERSDDNK